MLAISTVATCHWTRSIDIPWHPLLLRCQNLGTVAPSRLILQIQLVLCEIQTILQHDTARCSHWRLGKDLLQFYDSSWLSAPLSTELDVWKTVWHIQGGIIDKASIMHCAQAPQTQPKHICQSSTRKLQERGHWSILRIAIWVFLQELFQGHVSIGRMACRVELHFWWLVQATWTVSLCQLASNGSNSWDNKWKERLALLYQAREGTDSQISKMNKCEKISTKPHNMTIGARILGRTSSRIEQLSLMYQEESKESTANDQ